jgi:plasmid stabilization system protein ParE
MDELEEAIVAVAMTPERYAEYVEGTRRYVFPRFPFNLVYRVRPASILVVAVSHQRREPRYWASRAK